MTNAFGTRDEKSMLTYARRVSVHELRAVLAEALREGDRELANVLLGELKSRGC